MTTKVYTEHILPTILEDLKEQGFSLCQDADSAYKSKETLAWAKERDLSLLTLPGVSPDFSILELLAHSLKRAFYSVRCTTNKATLARFNQIFMDEMDQRAIQGMYEWYTKRLHECRWTDDQVTRY
jgi:hypothetical protein